MHWKSAIIYLKLIIATYFSFNMSLRTLNLVMIWCIYDNIMESWLIWHIF